MRGVTTPKLPSQVARVTRFPLVPRGGLAPPFTYNRMLRHFLRASVSCSHTSIRISNTERHGLNTMGYSGTPGLTIALVLAPCMRLSPHTAPSERFSRLAIWSVGAGTPGRITRRSKKRWLWVGIPFCRHSHIDKAGHQTQGAGAAT